MLKPTVSIAVILLLTTTAHAAKSLNLDQALEAFEHSPQIQQASSKVEESEWKRAEQFSNFLPTVSASAVHLLDRKYMYLDIPNFPTSIPQIIPDTIYTLGFTWTIFDGFANYDRYRAARKNELASKEDFEWRKFAGRREVVLAFYRSLGAQTLKQVAEQNLKVLQEHLHDVQLFRKAGISTKFDLLQVEVKSSEARSALLSAQDNAEISTLRLGELLGRDLRDEKLNGQLPELDEKLISGMTRSSQNRRDIGALQMRTEALQNLSTAAHKHWIPKVGLTGQFQQYNNRDTALTGDQFRNAYTVGVQLSWNYDGLIGPFARAGAAGEESFQAQKTLEMARLKAENDVEFWRRKFLYSTAVYKDRQDDIDRATESVRLAREGRKAGARTNTDLLDAEVELFRTRAQSIDAQIGAVEALINLELATGQQLYRFE